MDRESRAVIDAVQSFKRRAPKLKPGDRTISLALDAFAASSLHQKQTSGGTSSVASGVAISPNLLIDNNMIIPPPLLSHVAGATSPIQELKKSNHFYMESSNNTSNSYPDYSQQQQQHPHSHPHPHPHPHPHTHQMSRKPNIRRSDTLDVYGTGTFEMRKASSFNVNETDQLPSDVSISRRTNSMRHTIQTSSHPYGMIDDIGLVSSPNSQITAETNANNRRNCRMHKSFHDRSRQHDIKNEMCIDTVKCHSVGDDGSDDNLNVAITKRKLSPKFKSAESSLENEVFYTRSGSRGEMNSTSIDGIDGIDNEQSIIMGGNVSIPLASTSLSNARKSSASITHKHSSQSLDKPHHNFRRIARATQSFYLNSNQLDELRLHRAVHGATVGGAGGGGANDPKRISASMRGKPFREVVPDAKKSKSFITDPFASGSTEFELSPLRQDAIADIKKSPRSLSAYETKKLTNFTGNEMDYDIVNAYRQSRRKSSILSASGGGAATTNKKKIRTDSNVNDGNEIDDDGDTESSRKRKRIVCIVVSVFLSLVFASVFVVVFTLTYSSMAQASDYTKRIHNFAPGPGNRDSPIHHHNVRQENERIQETINRGKYVRNFTHAAFIGGQQQHHQP